MSLVLVLSVLAGAAEIDPLTAASTGAASYLTAAAVHEIAGHGLGCLAAGGEPLGFSTTYMVCDTSGMSAGGVRFGTFAGTGANLLVGGAFAATLAFAPPKDPWTRHYLWTSMASQLYLGGSYMLFGGLFGTGDFGEYLSTIPEGNRGPAQLAFIAGGATVLGLAFPLTLALAEPFLGPEADQRRRRKWALSLLPYTAVGVALMTVTGALNRGHGPGPGSAAALLGYGLGTVYFAYTPFLIGKKPAKSTPKAPLRLGRSPAWLAVGAASVVGLVVLGAGVGRMDPEPLDGWRGG